MDEHSLPLHTHAPCAHLPGGKFRQCLLEIAKNLLCDIRAIAARKASEPTDGYTSGARHDPNSGVASSQKPTCLRQSKFSTCLTNTVVTQLKFILALAVQWQVTFGTQWHYSTNIKHAEEKSSECCILTQASALIHSTLTQYPKQVRLYIKNFLHAQPSLTTIYSKPMHLRPKTGFLQCCMLTTQANSPLQGQAYSHVACATEIQWEPLARAARD